MRAKLACLGLLFTILISSCSDPASVGLELAPGNNQVGVFFAEFDLPAEVVLLDSFETTTNAARRGILAVGHEQDDFFGVTQATSYSRLSYSSSQKRPEADAILDSVFFTLRVISVNGTDLDQPKSYSVHKLNEQILDTVYFNTDKIPFQESALASSEITFNETKDTTVRLQVNQQFASEVFELYKGSREFSNIFNFRQYLPGIAIKAKEGDNTTIGLQQGENTGFIFYYHNLADTVASSFRITTSTSRGFVNVESDRSGTPTASVQEYRTAYDVGNKVGAKANLGMVIKINTHPIDEFLDSISGIVFNEVSFEMGEIESFPETQNPLFSGYLYLTDDTNNFIRRSIDRNPITVQSTNQPQVETDENGNQIPMVRAPAQVLFNQTSKTYSADITSHINALFRGTLTNKDWLFYGGIVSVGSEDDNFKKSLRQMVVRKDRIKVKAIYSKIK
ncbi:DUF4270 family protein [Algoriphagus sp.]|uniref:DUF4270 family protein n=1 Tax=Algoriphagus sp. TaxID=1872435 RepID=UPI00257FC6F8|nr:DUF4270 family protein [Algoriphagus sp.]